MMSVQTVMARLERYASLARTPPGIGLEREVIEQVKARAPRVRRADGSASGLVPALVGGTGPDPLWRLERTDALLRVHMSSWVREVAAAALVWDAASRVALLRSWLEAA